MTGSDWSNQGRTSPNGTDEYKTTESQSQGVIAPKLDLLRLYVAGSPAVSTGSHAFYVDFLNVLAD